MGPRISKRWWPLILSLAAVAALWMCRPRPSEEPQVEKTVDVPSRQEIDEGIRVGAPQAFDNLTVFAIFADDPTQLGRFTTLRDALENKKAEVREVGEDDSEARVNELMIANEGDLPLLVLAGTVVTGGKQDRQIAQDYVIEPGKEAKVEAFCVEQSRWNSERDGEKTDGRFRALPQLAASKVRAAGQLSKNQGKVWEEVAKVNAANNKHKPSGSLAASLEDAELTRRRDNLAKTITTHLDGQRPASKLVGLAYAVDGEVRSLRWFMNPQVFALHRDALVKTAALEALTAAGTQDDATKGKHRRAAAAMRSEQVSTFMRTIEAEKAESETDGHHLRSTRRGKKGYGWQLDIAAAATGSAAAESAAPAAKPAKARPVTKGYTLY